MVWHRIAVVLKNLAELGRRIELGSCSAATLEVICIQTESVANSG
jgi:hypothetical protein